MKLKHLLLCSLLLFTISCKVAFVPKSSAEAIASVHRLQSDISSLYDGYIAADDKKFDESKYTDVGTDIDNLILLENARPKAKNIVRQAVLVQDKFNEYKSEHKASVSSTNAKFRVYKKYLQDLVKPLEISELSLKP